MFVTRTTSFGRRHIIEVSSYFEVPLAILIPHGLKRIFCLELQLKRLVTRTHSSIHTKVQDYNCSMKDPIWNIIHSQTKITVDSKFCWMYALPM
jgi:hypothetical protein